MIWFMQWYDSMIMRLIYPWDKPVGNGGPSSHDLVGLSTFSSICGTPLAGDNLSVSRKMGVHPGGRRVTG